MKWLVLLCLALAGCGSEVPELPVDAGASVDAIPPALRFLPLAPGATWTWQVTPGMGARFDKTTTVEGTDVVRGAPAFRLRTSGDGTDTLSWQDDTGSAVRRLREQSLDASGGVRDDTSYEPYKLRLDESNQRLVVGASYTETYVEASTDSTGAVTRRTKSEVWTVEAIDEAVGVPAGSFTCLRVRRVGADAGGSDKRFWFARGVGKIKESGGQTEELKSYSLGP